ncbi:hypothetical protein UA75_07415 [Actinoalloteichus sp. GBA129-24]|nr:hypothetical protein UA75_07415 [Actinoalloteichus sp. GBA129-24]
MARDVHRGTWTVTGAGVPKQLTTLVDYEADACSMTVVTPLLIPGLLQTRPYAHAIMSAAGGLLDDTVIGARVMYRMGRQDILRSAEPPTFTSVLTEWALQSPVGGHATMAEQLARLTEWMRHDHIDVRVVPAAIGASLSSAGNFSIYEFSKATPVVHLEHISASVFVDDVREVADFVAARETILSETRSSAESAALIEHYLSYHRKATR